MTDIETEMEQVLRVETAEIIISGTEITSGKTLDTNSRFIARALSEMGIECRYITTVDDDRERLESAFRTALGRADLIVSCGGLGPTDDDLSMELAAHAAGLSLQKNAFCEEHIRSRFAGRDIPISENNWKQALMPENARVLPNERGTACGAVFHTEVAGRMRQIAMLPGPPGEMENMFNRYLLPLLRNESVHRLYSLSFRTVGIGESALEMMLRDLIRNGNGFTIATYAGQGEVQLRVSRNAGGDETPEAFDQLCAEIRTRLGRHIYEEGDRSLAEVVSAQLKARNWRVAFAESCTAGMLASEMAGYSGASAVLAGSIVSYANEVKEKVLGVPAEILRKDGAVSAACVLAMAEGARKLCDTDIAISVSGYAGPEGGTEADPVGTVYIGLSTAHDRFYERYSFHSERNQNRARAVTRALDFLRRYLEDHPLAEP